MKLAAYAKEHWPKAVALAILLLFGTLALAHNKARAKDMESSMSKIIHDYDSKECARLLEEQQAQDDQILAAQQLTPQNKNRPSTTLARNLNFSQQLSEM